MSKFEYPGQEWSDGQTNRQTTEKKEILLFWRTVIYDKSI